MAAPETAMALATAGRRSPPPPSSALSKRDRKRQQLMDRLAATDEQFQREKNLTYRDQLQRIQLDINLVQSFDPYAPNALDVIGGAQSEHDQVQREQAHDEGARSLLDMAGIKFHTFMTEMEDLIEKRDFQLTRSKNEYDRKVQEYKSVRDYKIETAKREHRALTGTLRDRLINTLTQKKNRLSREKEVLEINDSNALLLNPNQFSITNPASPGGTHGKRNTRLRKDVEDLNMFSDKKRKRNAGDDDGSPAPTRRALDANNTTPLWQSEKARVAAKQNGPLYSIDKLFTDKELSMHYNTAAVAAHQYILRSRVHGNGASPDESDSGTGDAENGEQDNESAAAPTMERQVSHATRSTRGAANQNFLDDRILGIEGIANLDVANLDLIHAQEPPKMPPPVPQQYLKPYPRSADQNFPVPLSQEDVQSDLAIIDCMKRYDMQNNKPGAVLDGANGVRKILEAVATPYRNGRYVAFTRAPRDDAETFRDGLGLREQASPMPHGAAPMSRQSSLGGVAMSRSGSTRGRGRRA
ncbi:uncharacterized protein J7T54_007448 [Emericellopsis cladophorae]|uniref:Deacetylase complex subunit n=1 Tax=Emericellopsis cladophorae TaxID=2686198 RepID=A0A9P9XW12_9HYPO|nr:uncharacterized protein J7T54_007448 [Emericellopsis cladophorae]KAI6778795.1 hypothetical protein J7T54_007448 [Emericellopsis cladophorae]